MSSNDCSPDAALVVGEPSKCKVAVAYSLNWLDWSRSRSVSRDKETEDIVEVKHSRLKATAQNKNSEMREGQGD